MSIHLSKQGRGPTLVLFHGWGFDSQVWQSIVPLLSESFQLICVDLPGFGLTQPMDFVAFKDKLLPLLPERFALVGWSLGGLYATRLALETSDRVQALINVCSSPCFVSNDDWPGVDKLVFEKFYENLTADPQQTLRDFVLLQAQRKSDCMPTGMPSASSLKQGLDVLYSWDLRDKLAELTIPVSYFFGRLDPITPKAAMLMLQTRYPQFNYVLFNKAAHMPFISHAEEFVSRISQDRSLTLAARICTE